MTDAELLDAAVVRTWAQLAVEALGRSRTALDGVNVFPVADGDTGTNMYLTLREAAHALQDAPSDAGGARLLRLLARGALLGARGNSGVILSEWLRGLAVAATRRDPLAPALDAAARNARLAVAHPEAGTILTAAEVAAAAARHTAADPAVTVATAEGRQAVLDAARQGAREAALSSVATLAALRAAGVLDAGACGLVLVLDALAAAHQAAARTGVSVAGGTMTPVLDLDLRTRPAAAPDAGDEAVPVHLPGRPNADPHADQHDHQHDHAHVASAREDELELMFVLRRPAGAGEFGPGGVAEALRADLDGVGESVVVVGGALATDGEGADGVWQAHVHTGDLGAGLAVARRWAGVGGISNVHLRHLAVPAAGWGVVAVTSAPTLARDLARGGAVVLLDLDVRPVAADIAQAALGAGTGKVIVLPGPVADAAAGVPAALASRLDQARDGDDPEVVVLDAHDDLRVVTAVASLAEAQADVDQDAAAVAQDALGRLRTGRADASEPASWMTALAGLVEAVQEPVVVTVLVDAEVPAEVVAELEAVAAKVAPDAEVVVLPTGRAGTGIALGVEAAGSETNDTEGGVR